MRAIPTLNVRFLSLATSALDRNYSLTHCRFREANLKYRLFGCEPEESSVGRFGFEALVPSVTAQSGAFERMVLAYA